eukprot:9334375-Pyramimonas_sp.AAC.2
MVDGHFMKRISGEAANASKTEYKAWVTTQAKIGKTIYCRWRKQEKRKQSVDVSQLSIDPETRIQKQPVGKPKKPKSDEIGSSDSEILAREAADPELL